MLSPRGPTRVRRPWLTPPGSTGAVGVFPWHAILLYAGFACWELCAPAPAAAGSRCFPAVCQAANWLASKRARAAGARDHEGAGRAPGTQQRQQRQRIPAAGGADEAHMRTLASVLVVGTSGSSASAASVSRSCTSPGSKPPPRQAVCYRSGALKCNAAASTSDYTTVCLSISQYNVWHRAGGVPERQAGGGRPGSAAAGTRARPLHTAARLRLAVLLGFNPSGTLLGTAFGPSSGPILRDTLGRNCN